MAAKVLVASATSLIRTFATRLRAAFEASRRRLCRQVARGGLAAME
jgi:hypothetical protein